VAAERHVVSVCATVIAGAHFPIPRTKENEVCAKCREAVVGQKGKAVTRGEMCKDTGCDM
jgi:hypothetical protein